MEIIALIANRNCPLDDKFYIWKPTNEDKQVFIKRIKKCYSFPSNKWQIDFIEGKLLDD